MWKSNFFFFPPLRIWYCSLGSQKFYPISRRQRRCRLRLQNSPILSFTLPFSLPYYLAQCALGDGALGCESLYPSSQVRPSFYKLYCSTDSLDRTSVWGSVSEEESKYPNSIANLLIPGRLHVYYLSMNLRITQP